MDYSDFSTSDLLNMYSKCLSYDAPSFEDQELNTDQMHELAHELRVIRNVAIVRH